MVFLGCLALSLYRERCHNCKYKIVVPWPVEILTIRTGHYNYFLKFFQFVSKCVWKRDMKVFAVSDIHGEIKYFEAAAELIRSSDLVVLCGDLTKTGDPAEAEKVVSCIESLTTNIIAVHGNWDRNEVCTFLEGKGYSVHGRGRIIDRIGFFGVGGSSQTPMNTASEYSEDEIAVFLNAGYRDIAGAEIRVLISHTPPRQIRDRTFIGLRGGSRSVREFMNCNRVDLCLVGHIHEAHGVERMNNSIVANSGSFKKGRYSFIDIGSSITLNQGKF
jgi:Icc-related predicted phosphoesterase